MTDDADNVFRQAHEPLEALLRAHLLAVIGGHFAEALQLLQTWQRALQAHIELEETQLLPHIPDHARWAARVYELEHKRISALATDYQHLVQAVASRLPASGSQTRAAASLHVLDAAHALRHLLEHHHQREEKALADELPLVLQRSVLLREQADPASR